MTREEKQLLLKDLCGRLPYGVKVWNSEFLDLIEEYYPNEILTLSDLDYYIKESIEIKPYLRPMSSMTKDEKEEYRNECNKVLSMPFKINGPYPIVDWLNAHHFDHRGLIPMGLALEAPEGIYKNE